MTKVHKPIKASKKPYKINGKEATIANVKANKTDTSGTYYVYDLYDGDGKLIALNRYCMKSGDKQPFATLTKAEELILNPPIVESKPMETI